MKTIIFLAAVFFYCAGFLCTVYAENSVPKTAGILPQAANLNVFWSGSWENTKTLHNRAEARIFLLQSDFLFRCGILDRRPLNFELLDGSWDNIWGDPQKRISQFTGGLYHNPTGSRLLYGVLDEWGLPARIRNPWIRSPPYTENHRQISASLKTAVSSTKSDEAYIYLSSPFLNLPADIKLRGFASAQTEVKNPIAENYGNTLTITPARAFSGGLDFKLPNKMSFIIETFYTQRKLSQEKSNTWFSNEPPLPERESRLSAAGLIFKNPNFSISSDFAVSDTFAYGTDIYVNLGLSLTPPLSSGRIIRPLSFSIAVDGAGERFVYRDGADRNPAFRTAGKIEWKRSYGSLLRIDTVLRGERPAESFNKSSSGFSYYFPHRNNSNRPFRMSRIYFSADRNIEKSENSEKINDTLLGGMRFFVSLPGQARNKPLGLHFTGNIKGLLNYEGNDVFVYPIPSASYTFDTASAACEFSWSPLNLQLRTKFGYTVFAEKEAKWNFSISAAARFRHGRFSIRASSGDFTRQKTLSDWDWTVSWRLNR